MSPAFRLCHFASIDYTEGEEVLQALLNDKDFSLLFIICFCGKFCFNLEKKRKADLGTGVKYERLFAL